MKALILLSLILSTQSFAAQVGEDKSAEVCKNTKGQESRKVAQKEVSSSEKKEEKKETKAISQ